MEDSSALVEPLSILASTGNIECALTHTVWPFLISPAGISSSLPPVFTVAVFGRSFARDSIPMRDFLTVRSSSHSPSDIRNAISAATNM